MMPPFGTLKQICPSVSGITDSSSRKNKKKSSYPVGRLGAERKDRSGQCVEAADLEFWR